MVKEEFIWMFWVLQVNH